MERHFLNSSRRLVDVAPNLTSELEDALIGVGSPELAMFLRSGEVGWWTYDPSVDAGYIYLALPDAPRDARPREVAETVPFFAEAGFNVDVAHDGGIFGIEFLGRDDVLSALRAIDGTSK
jgi:uncharacterized protein YuzE